MTMPIGDPDPARQARAAAAAEEAQRKALEAGQSTAAEAPAGAEAAKASAAAPASEAAAKGPVLPADLYTETGAEAPDKGQPGAEKVAKASGGDFMNKLSTGKKGAGLAVLALVKNIVRQADQALRETEAKREAPGHGPAEPESRTHKLQSGETLSKVAKGHGVSLEALRAANPRLSGMDERKLAVGFELVLPPETKAPAAGNTQKPDAAKQTRRDPYEGLTKVDLGSDALGKLSAAEESDGYPGVVSSGVGDKGGKSYGMVQLASNEGAPQEFVKWLEKKHPETHKALAGKKPRSEDFDKAWQELAAKDPKGFAQIQHDYIQQKYYAPLKAAAEKAVPGLDLDKRSRTLRDVLWSTAVQHKKWTPTIFQRALAGKDVSKMSDAEIIRAVYAERGKRDSDGRVAYFKGNSARTQESVARRFVREEKAAQQMLQAEQRASAAS
jgi:LysM repeat protein